LDNIIDMLEKGTNYAAWWGAVVATIVLVWDIYKWKKTGPKVSLKVSADMQTFGSSFNNKVKKYVTVRAINSGDKSTTITNLACRYYKNWLSKIRNKPYKFFCIVSPGITGPIPYNLEPGKVWDGFIGQTKEIEKMATEGILVCELYISHSNRPKISRIYVTISQNEQDP
jgi:hypothetical protein